MQTAEVFALDRTLSILTRTPVSVDALLRGLPDFWVQQNEGKDTWTAFGIVGHLIFADRTDWMPRLLRILEHGDQPVRWSERPRQFVMAVGRKLAEMH